MTLKEALYILLQEHLCRHAAMEWIDVYKLLYQGVYGGEHLHDDVQSCKIEFYEEWRRTPAKPEEPLMERVSVDGSRVRLNFSRCRHEGIEPETVWEAFSRSKRSPHAQQQLCELLTAFIELCRQGRLPFDLSAVEKGIGELTAAGLPPCRHSAAYRETERPAYRVAEKTIFEAMLTRRQGK